MYQQSYPAKRRREEYVDYAQQPAYAPVSRHMAPAAAPATPVRMQPVQRVEVQPGPDPSKVIADWALSTFTDSARPTQAALDCLHGAIDYVHRTRPAIAPPPAPRQVSYVPPNPAYRQPAPAYPPRGPRGPRGPPRNGPPGGPPFRGRGGPPDRRGPPRADDKERVTTPQRRELRPVHEFSDPSQWLRVHGDPSAAKHTGQPEAGRNGNWACSSCKNTNFPRRSRCFRCHTRRESKDDRLVHDYIEDLISRVREQVPPNPSDYLKESGDPLARIHAREPPNPAGPSEGHDGNWACECRNVNFPRRDKCYRCQRPRDENADGVVRRYVEWLIHAQDCGLV